MKKSELRKMVKEVITEESNWEEEYNTLLKIEHIAKKYSLMAMRKPLESIFKKKDIDFVTEPIPHFRIKHNGKTILIVNKRYIDSAEIIVGNIAIGYE